jgi:hypothetical protein
MTTMKVQKSVYPPRTAVRGSEIRLLLLSTFRTVVLHRFVSVPPLAIPVEIHIRPDHQCHKMTLSGALVVRARSGNQIISEFLEGDPFEVAREIRHKAEPVMHQAHVM